MIDYDNNITVLDYISAVGPQNIRQVVKTALKREHVMTRPTKLGE